MNSRNKKSLFPAPELNIVFLQQYLNKIESLRKVGVDQFVFGSPLGPKKAQAVEFITQGNPNNLLESP